MNKIFIKFILNCIFIVLINSFNVNLHVERFNKKLNLYHIGISFSKKDCLLRYDFRAFPEEDEYLTWNSCYTNNFNSEEENINEYLNHLNFIKDNNDGIETKIKYWGYTNKSLSDIIIFEESLHKRYVLGVYDCRHYVRDFTKWCLNKPTPVWKLKEFWIQIK